MDDFFEAADLWDADEWLPDPDSEPDPDEESSSEPESEELPEEESVKIQVIYNYTYYQCRGWLYVTEIRMSTTIYVVDTEKSILGAIRELWEMAFGQKAPFYGCKQIKRNMFS